MSERMLMSDDLVPHLERVDVFSGMSKRALRRVLKSGREVDHQAGREIAVEGMDGHAFHLILEGVAHVQVGSESRPDLGPGDYFGEISVIDNKPRSATVTAGEDGLKVFAIPGFGIHAALKSEPEMAQALLVNLCARIRKSEAASAG
jgi:CRP/FNR family transcriptional regulator, cyclic AMP receptor protein